MSNTLDSRFTKESDFWNKRLHADTQISKFPPDFIYENPQKYISAEYSCKLPDDICGKLVSMSNGSDYALYMILLTGIRFVLGKYIDEQQATVVMPVFRQNKESESLLNSILPLIIDTGNLKSFKELLLETKRVVTEANANQNFPVINNLKLPCGENGIPVLHTAALLENIHEKDYLKGLNTDILFEFIKKSDAIELTVQYNSPLYSSETVEEISLHLSKFFDIVTKQRDILLDDIIIMTPEESKKIHSRLQNMQNANNIQDSGLSSEFVENKLLSILKKQLGSDEIGLDDDFFYDLGGNSLIAISFWTEVTKELNFELPLSKIFGSPTIRSMAKSISSTVKGSFSHIEPVEKKEYYPVSAAQQRMYIVNQVQDGGMEYNIPVAMIIDGAVDTAYLTEIFRKLIRRHESLRTSFRLEEGVPVQVVHESTDFEIEWIELSKDIGAKQRDAATEQNLIGSIIEKFRRPFDLSKAPLFRAALCEISGNRYILMLDAHHIISDGMSMSIITREFISLYEGKELLELPIQYKDFSVWQNELLKSDEIRKQEEYWTNTFAGELPVLNVPSDYPRPAIQSLEGDEILFRIDNELLNKLKPVISETGSTLYMLLLASYTTLLHKYTDQQDIIVGSPVAGRTHSDLENIVGMFVNTLAMRNYPQHEKSFKEFLREVRNNTLNVFENQDYQLERFVKKVNIHRDASRNPLFDTMFILQNIKRSKLEISGLEITPHRFKTGNSKFDIVLVAEESEDGLEFSLEYCTKLYKKERMQKLAGHFVNILKEVAANPDKTLAEIDMLSEAEKQQILFDFNNTDLEYRKETTVHRMFEEQAAKTPDNIALVFEDDQITYAELNQKANILAHILKEKGVGPDYLVGIAVTRSIGMIVGILAVLKAGGAYLPIDIEYPEERTKFMLEDSGAGILLSQHSIADRLNFAGEMVYVDDSGLCTNFYSKENARDSSNLGDTSHADNLAYVIYTSGSTGKPKGVMLEHRSVNNFINGMTKKIDFSADKTILAVTTISFDIFVLETLLSLTKGLKVVLANESQQKEPGLMSKLIKDHKIDIVQATPSRAGMLLEYSGLELFSGVKQIILGGEAFPKSLLDELSKLEGIRIFNGYGPTETTVYSTVKELTGADAVTIGRPIANTRIYILGKNNSVKPVLTAGELCIAGDGLARGYLNRPDLTSQKFVDDPFRSGERMYRTGDLAMWLPDGEIEFLGRIDHQVKIRGYRIEIGEVETEILKHVKEAAVIDKEDSNGTKYLCAYVVYDEKLKVSELREQLSKELPKYMVPSYFIQLEKLPLTPNGKIDRNALPEPDLNNKASEYVPPGNSKEEELAAVWQEVLEVDSVGVYDNFYELGGDSIKAVRIAGRLRNYSVNVKNIMQYPTIAQLQEKLIEGKAEQENSRFNAGMTENLELEYHYFKNGESDLFAGNLDCSQQMLYFIFKKKCKNYVEYQHLFAMNFIFYAMLNEDNSLYSIESVVYPLKEDIFKLNIYHSKGYGAMARIEELLDSGEQVIVATHVERLPFHDHFEGFDEPSGDVNSPNPFEDGTTGFTAHTFLVVAHEAENLYYVEIPTILNQEYYVPYAGNKSVGIIRKNDLKAAFDVFVSFATVDINFENLEKRDYLRESMELSMQYYRNNVTYRCTHKILFEEDAIDFLISLCDSKSVYINTDAEMVTKNLLDLIRWKFYAIAGSRYLLTNILKNYKGNCNKQVQSELTEVLYKAYNAWRVLPMIAMRKFHDEKDYLFGEEYRNVFIEARSLEKRILELIAELWE